jgi:hypothetical protein
MPWISVIAVFACPIIAFFVRDNPYLLTITATVWGISLTNSVERTRHLDRNLFWSVVKASTIYRRRLIRISFAYLIAIESNNKYLLVRGRRIPTQFQPVGGVFKTDLTMEERRLRFNAIEDSRFPADEDLSTDLRMAIPGKELSGLLKWFRKGIEREILPLREFYEELVAAEHLDAQNFRYIDCERIGERSFPLRVDIASGMPQLILAEIWRLRPTPGQAAELAAIRNPRTPKSTLMAERTQLEGLRTSQRPANYEIAPTAKWLLATRRH